jgi:hypothetical protein
MRVRRPCPFFPHKTTVPKQLIRKKTHFDRISLQGRKEIKLELKVLYANRDGSLCLAEPTARPPKPEQQNATTSQNNAA